MRNVKELYHVLNGKYEFEEKYPFYQEDDGKVHVLYVAPCINGTGFYRMILPMLELNKTGTHVAIVSTIHKWSFSKQFDDYDNPLDKRLIEWADYVVLPAIFSDVSYVLKSLLEINPDLQFVMDMDCNYHAYPKEHPNYKKFTKQHGAILLSNIAQMDILTGASESLLQAYDSRIEKKHPTSNVVLEYQPNLISNFGFQELEAIKQNDSGKLRIGIVGNYGSYYDTLSMKEALFQIKEKYKDKVQFIFFGWNGKHSKNEEPFKDFDFVFEKSVSFLDYYSKLNDLVIDIALLPSTSIDFNTKGKSFIKYLELSAFAIPVVASNATPYREVIDDEDTGMLASTTEEWTSKVESLIEDAEYRHTLGKAALKNTWRNYSYTARSIKILTDIFI
ncbi:glycosyltransferase [uncultured Sunxiuqinia sp.]|uniref:glycosyltransferase n=1 Tax=uncultured Sunxiuqinia sp. TaxID=1573825 RepID=UPI0030DB5447